MTPTVPAWAEHLDLAPHPEGGWYAETWRSELTLSRDVLPSAHTGDRSAGTAILFLLPDGAESAWHTVAGAEIWLHHRGSPIELVLGGTGTTPGVETTIVLGPDLAAGQRPQHLVAPGEWQRARPVPGHPDGAGLVSCVVVPGFDFADFRLRDPVDAPAPSAEG
jgi:predicted cupin superfamily sugar epimerase